MTYDKDVCVCVCVCVCILYYGVNLILKIGHYVLSNMIYWIPRGYGHKNNHQLLCFCYIFYVLLTF